MTNTARILLGGGGLAAASAAEATRPTGFDGELTLIDDTFVHDADLYMNHGVTVHPADPAVAIDRDARQVVCGSGRTLDDDRLLLATNAAPRRLRLPVRGSRCHGACRAAMIAGPKPKPASAEEAADPGPTRSEVDTAAEEIV